MAVDIDAQGWVVLAKQKTRAAELLEHRPIVYYYYREWHSITVSAISRVFKDPHEKVLQFKEVCGSTVNRETAESQMADWLEDGVRILDFMITEAELPVVRTHPLPDSNGVFLVHGHDPIVMLSVEKCLRRLRLEPIILQDEPNKGRTVIEKFEECSKAAAYAVVLLTPDDIGYVKGNPQNAHERARQNVIFELGFFFGKLGRGKVSAIYKDEVELPSDYSGVLFIPWSGNWENKLIAELTNAALPIDLKAYYSSR